MVLLLLSIKAELENVTELLPSDDFEYFFEVKCSSCNELHSKPVSLNRTDSREISGGKGGTANFVWKCGLCKRESWAKFDSSKTVAYQEENGQFGGILKIECRGLEFTAFDPRGTWECKGSGPKKTTFTDVNLEEGEWNDYDENNAQPVGITEFQSQFTRA